MADPGDNDPPQGHEGERRIAYGPFRRRGTYEDHGDNIEERNRDLTHVARIGARGDVIDEAVVPAIGLVMLTAAMERMSLRTIPTNSDDSIATAESAVEETAGSTSRIRNVFARCCNTDTSSLDGGETSNAPENPSTHSLNGEILNDLQSVDIISEVDVNAGSDIKEVSHRSSELSATLSGDHTNQQEVAELSGETTPKEVVKSVLDVLIERVCPEPEELVRPILDELVDKVVSMQPSDADIPSDVLGPKEKEEKVSKIRQVISTILCKKGPNGNESASTISTGSVHVSDIEGSVSSKLQVDAREISQANSHESVSTEQSSVQKVDSLDIKKKSKKSKIFRLFKRRSKERSKGPKVGDNKVHPEDVEKCSSQTNSSSEAANESEGNPPRVSAAQTQILCQKADDTGTLPIVESPKKPKKKDVLRKMFHYCICIGSAYDEVNDDDECDETTVSLESN